LVWGAAAWRCPCERATVRADLPVSEAGLGLGERGGPCGDRRRSRRDRRGGRVEKFRRWGWGAVAIGLAGCGPSGQEVVSSTIRGYCVDCHNDIERVADLRSEE